jgi:hypothetical protein
VSTKRSRTAFAAVVLALVVPIFAQASPRDSDNPGSGLDRIVKVIKAIKRIFVPIVMDDPAPPHP